MGLMWATWVLSGHALELGKFRGSHMASVTWAPHVKPIWEDCMSPIRDVGGLSRHGHKQDKLYGTHIVSDTLAPHVKLMGLAKWAPCKLHSDPTYTPYG